MTFQREREFTLTKYPVISRKAYPSRIEDVLSHPVSGWKKARQFDSIPRLASNFCQPNSSATYSCCTTGTTRTTTSVSTVQLLFSCLNGSETLEIYIFRQFTDSLETVHQQSVVCCLRARARQNISVCLSVCL